MLPHPQTVNDLIVVERIENGFVTRATTRLATRTLYHSNIRGVVAELNRAFGISKLNKDQSGFLSEQLGKITGKGDGKEKKTR